MLLPGARAGQQMKETVKCYAELIIALKEIGKLILNIMKFKNLNYFKK